MPERLPLPQLPAALSEAGYETASYRALYEAALDARIPARQGHNGRWTVALDDLPEIAAVMGLDVATAA